MPNDNALMQSVQQGQLGRLADLFEQNHVALYHFFLRLGNNPATSEDLVQETFMKVIEYRHSFDGISSFRAWLYGIARNTSADAYRRQQRAPQAVEQETLDNHSAEDMQETMERAQMHDKFSLALNNLPDELRDILILHRYQQLRYDEIAELLNCNLNTLKSKMRKAVSELHIQYSLLTGAQ